MSNFHVDDIRKAPRATAARNKMIQLADDTIVASNCPVNGLESFIAGYSPTYMVSWIELIKSNQPGAGRAAVERLVEWTKEQGGVAIYGEALERSIGFWKKMGFEVSSKPTSKWRYPMVKRL